MPKWVRFLCVAFAFFLLAVVAALGGMAYAFRGTFYPGTQVGSLPVAGLTEEGGRQRVAAAVATYGTHPFHIVIPDLSKPIEGGTNQYEDAEVATTAADLGVTFSDTAAVDAAWQIGHQRNVLTWLRTIIPALFAGKAQPLPYSIDSAAIDTFVNTQVAPKIGGPQPALIAISGTTVTVTPPYDGFSVDQKELSRLLAKSLDAVMDNDTTYLRAPVILKSSDVTQQDVQPLATVLDTLANLKITLADGAVSLSPTRAQLLSWFAPVQDEEGSVNLVVQQEAIAKYLTDSKANIDLKVSVDAVLAKVTPLLSKPIDDVAPGGKLAIAIKAKADSKTEPGQYTLGKFEGKYVEVSLKEQKLYRINGSTLEKVYVISSGKWGTPTPKGIFKIATKAPRAYSATWGLYMPYWQNLLAYDETQPQLKIGEYGLHELPEWPNGYKEGQSHLGTPVSHGCVRLGIGDAKELYEWTAAGTPVWIH